MAVDICGVSKFKRKQKVVAATDLVGVPAGTEGKVFYESGVTWFRYHVRFENGVELSNVDGNKLWSVSERDERVAEQARQERVAARDAEQARLAASVVPTAPH